MGGGQFTTIKSEGVKSQNLGLNVGESALDGMAFKIVVLWGAKCPPSKIHDFENLAGT